MSNWNPVSRVNCEKIMDGMNANFPGGNATNMLQQMNYSSMQNIPNQSIPGPNINNLSNHVNSINNSNNNPADICNPKRQVVFDRLKKRMHNYRKRQGETVPRFDQTFNGICEQQSVETNVLQKRFIETKAKRVAKKADKKQTETAPSGNLVSFFFYYISPSPSHCENYVSLTI